MLHTVVEPVPQPFGALLDGLLVKFAEVALFPPAASNAERKSAILDARLRDDLTDRQADMLIQVFGLAGA